MKYIITAVPIGPRSRKRTGKARVEVIDTKASIWADTVFGKVTTVSAMETAYESFYKLVGADVKVVDVRMVPS